MKSNNRDGKNQSSNPNNSQNNNSKPVDLRSKESALSLLNQAGITMKDVDSLNMALLGIADILASENSYVPDELANPQNYDSISRDHLTLVRDRAKQTLGENLLPQSEENAPGLLPTNTANPENENPGNAIVNSEPKDLDRGAEQVGTNREHAIESFRAILNDLGVNYVAEVVGQSLSDDFWLTVDQAKARRDEQHLEKRVELLKGDFHEAIDAIKGTAQKRKDWEQERLGKLATISDFSEMDEAMKSLQNV